MPGLPGTLLTSVKQALRSCDDVFFDQLALRNVFFNEKLKPWQAGLPEARNLDQRVDFTIGYLLEKYRKDGENALVILLRVLAERYEDDRLEQLNTLANQLDWLNQLPPTKLKTESTRLEANPAAAQMLSIVEAEKMLACARSVARTSLRRSRNGNLEDITTGTGWLIAPGLAITCWHVIEAKKRLDTPIEPADLQAQLANMLITFDYTVAGKGLQYSVASLVYPTIDTQVLDYAIMRLNDRDDEPLSKRGYLRLDVDAPLTALSSLYIIQHPLGQPQQMAGDTFERLSPIQGRILYKTPTEPGTSGAPVFNRVNWRVVALHNGENEAVRLREGTQLKPILSELEQHKPDVYDEIMAAQHAKE